MVVSLVAEEFAKRRQQGLPGDQPVPVIGIGGGLAAAPLPHHRAYGSVHGGSVG
jgi:hypothetical protein